VSRYMFWGAATAALIVALVINYQHSVQAFAAAGYTPVAAHLAGVTPDLVMIAATARLMDDWSGSAGRRWLPAVLLGVGIAMSAGINAWVALGTPPAPVMVVSLWVAPTVIVAALAPLAEQAQQRAPSEGSVEKSLKSQLTEQGVEWPAAPWPEDEVGDRLAEEWMAWHEGQTGEVATAAQLAVPSGWRRDGRARRVRRAILDRTQGPGVSPRTLLPQSA